MARYIKTPDIWDLDDTARAALQPGQHILCGGDPHGHGPSRFYRYRPGGHVVAFHGPKATRKMMAYIASGKAHNERTRNGAA